MKTCVFFDRDGIVNRSPGPGWVERWEDFHLMPEFVAALGVVRRLGYEAVVVTNQRGVSLGNMSEQDVVQIHANLRAALAYEGLELLDIYFCPHDRDQCDCRKPQPGMLLRAAAEHGLDLAGSWMVGDQEHDVEAGRRAGCRTIRVGPPDCGTSADYRVDSMAALAAGIEQILTGG